MAQQMNLEKLLDFDKRDFAALGALYIKTHRELIKRGYGVTDNNTAYRFPNYTEHYAELKRKRFQKQGGGRYASHKGRAISSTQTNPPDFTLTGMTLRDLGVLYTYKDAVNVGWRGEAAQVVGGNEKRGKYKVWGATDKEIELLGERLTDIMDRNWRTKVKDVNITVGK